MREDYAKAFQKRSAFFKNQNSPAQAVLPALEFQIAVAAEQGGDVPVNQAGKDQDSSSFQAPHQGIMHLEKRRCGDIRHENVEFSVNAGQTFQ
jgi:hypothetical protein